MTGRKGLTLVTALTVASLLLGGSVLNALAEEHGNNGHDGGNEKGKAEHQKQKPAVVVNQSSQTQSVHNDQQGDDNNNLQRGHHDDDDEDLVTPPARVTDEERPGKGCGDENHKHARSDECKAHNDDEDNNQDNADVMTTAVDEGDGD